MDVVNRGREDKVIGTNDDACYAKFSASTLNYFSDEFVSYFATAGLRKMPPLINRGYYTRVSSFRILMDDFLKSGDEPKQIVSFGAGFDTNYFRLRKRFMEDNSQPFPFKYFELDFAQVVKQKSRIIQQTPNLSSLIPEMAVAADGTINSPTYSLHHADLCSLPAVQASLLSQGLSLTLPTLFLSECVLIYIPPEDSARLIEWTSNFFKKAVFLVYEQIKPYDAFGETMLRNLENRGVPLASIKKYPDLNSQKARFTKLGYTHVEAKDMNEIFKHLLDPTENKRIARLEIFDEFEEWYIIQGHYCVILATFDKSTNDTNDTGESNAINNSNNINTGGTNNTINKGIWEHVTLSKNKL